MEKSTLANLQQIQEQLKKADTTKIFFTDLNGRVVSLTVNPENIVGIIENGVGFDGSSIAGYARVENSDRLLFPDPETFKLVPFADEMVGFFLGNIFNARGTRAPTDPRAALENVVAEAESEFGYRFTVGPEHEFFILSSEIFSDQVHSDSAKYFLATPHDKGDVVRNRIIDILKQCGIKFEKTHHEVTPSQHEINLEPAAPMKAADRTVLFNHITQKAAAELGYHATFMSKPFNGFNRNAFHIHISMQDSGGNNLFYDEKGQFNLSGLARQFIAGILKYARETSVIMASTYNSYKAYVIEREAPIVRGWGYANRSSMVRIPYCDNPHATRMELRNPDATGNVYLQLAVLIGMGLRGIREKLDCGQPDARSTYNRSYRTRVLNRQFLPKSLFEALMEAEKSKFLREVLGNRLFENYLTLKTQQWEEHRTHVTPLEHEKYLMY